MSPTAMVDLRVLAEGAEQVIADGSVAEAPQEFMLSFSRPRVK